MADQLITGTTLIEDKRSEKGEIWSISGSAFIPNEPDVDDVSYDNNSWGEVTANTDNIWFNCPVNLPQGAIITSVIIYGNAAATAETYTLLRNGFAAQTAETLATGNIGTPNTTISNATIDNNSYHYWIRTSTIDTNDIIYGAIIKYRF